MAASSGDPVFDDMLGGGFPDHRSTLAIGGPETGKSTFAMQFLQSGLDQDEQCLFVSTEQTLEEFRRTFEDFPFDLTDENLTIVSVNAVEGDPVDRTSDLTIRARNGKYPIETGVDIPFEAQYLCDTLEEYAPFDRVVFDSASGLASLSDEEAQFRRAVLKLIRLFTNEIRATSLIVAEGRPGDPDSLAGHASLRSATHGVVRLWRENRYDVLSRYVRVEKMRSVDYDARRFTFQITPAGVSVVPRGLTHPEPDTEGETTSTGVDGSDDQHGGDPITGTNPPTSHDEQTDTQIELQQMMDPDE